LLGNKKCYDSSSADTLVRAGNYRVCDERYVKSLLKPSWLLLVFTF